MDELEAMQKKVLEIAVARRFERFKASLQVRYRLISGEEKKTLLRDGGYAAPGAFMAHASETKDLNQVMAEDISVGGLRISTPTPLELQSQLWVNLNVPGVPLTINALCSVVWTRPAGVNSKLFNSGLCFDVINQRDLEKVESFLALQKNTRRGPEHL